MFRNQRRLRRHFIQLEDVGTSEAFKLPHYGRHGLIVLQDVRRPTELPRQLSLLLTELFKAHKFVLVS